jgi:hypothetical protein
VGKPQLLIIVVDKHNLLIYNALDPLYKRRLREVKNAVFAKIQVK